MTAVSVLIEYCTIARVYNMVPALQEAKPTLPSHGLPELDFWTKAKSYLHGTAIYSQHPAFILSLSLALLYLKVLSFNGQMVTYLVALGVPSSMIGILRGVSAVFELSATWIAPRIMPRLGPIRAGIWFINWETICVSAACAFFWLDLDSVAATIGVVSAVVATG